MMFAQNNAMLFLVILDSLFDPVDFCGKITTGSSNNVGRIVKIYINIYPNILRNKLRVWFRFDYTVIKETFRNRDNGYV